MNRPITIVGGGLAGLTLGIGLRREGVPVSLFEAGTYPRHRVCGEFISGAGQQVLRRLGLEDLFAQAGATPARTARFFLRGAALPARLLPQPALCLSRYEMDAVLARRFVECGGQLYERSRWDQPPGPGTVLATGRRARPKQAGWHWFGLKIHARSVPLAADLEMHWQPDGYVGVCRLPGDEINICGLFRRREGRPTSHPGRDLLRGIPGTALHSRLLGAHCDEGSFCAVAGLDLGATLPAGNACRIGDSLTMTPPVTGNGMSMAFESAELALAPLLAYSSGLEDWAGILRAIAGRSERAFTRRLRWARWLHELMFIAASRPPVTWLLGSQLLWRTMFQMTRC